MQRSESLARFIEVVHDAVLAGTDRAGASNATTERIFSALQTPAGEPGNDQAQTLSACRHLEPALDNARAGPAPIPALAEAFFRLTPRLSWQRRAGAETHGAQFYDGHANTSIVGPEGLERRGDVLIGASLVAPRVRYPEHNHPPEELYVVMSEGDWYREEAGWYTPGVGGVVYHSSGVSHAMRSGPVPLLAIWCLWVGAVTRGA